MMRHVGFNIEMGRLVFSSNTLLMEWHFSDGMILSCHQSGNRRRKMLHRGIPRRRIRKGFILKGVRIFAALQMASVTMRQKDFEAGVEGLSFDMSAGPVE
jgi:hypothetical protein